MRQIINGISYDTDAASELARGDHGHESSQAWWALYKKPDGSFFEAVVDHDGAPEGIRPLTRRQARAFLEKTDNRLVEEHFGTMPESGPLRFSRQTRIAAIELLEHSLRGHSETSRQFLKLGSELAHRCEDGSVADRFNKLIKYLDEDETRRTDSEEFVQDAIVELAVSHLPTSEWEQPPEYTERQTTFLRALDLDGFTVVDRALRRTLPAELGLPEARDEVSRLLAKHGFATPKEHLDQALDAHGRGQWAAANSQIRSFYEGLLDEIAERLDPTVASLPGGESRRAKLGQLGFLDPRLNEWSQDGKNFTSGLMKRLHSSGSHPGLSDQEDSTFRRHVVLITAKLLLSRLDGWPR